MVSNWVCCIMDISVLSRILSYRWRAVVGQQVANLLGIRNRKQPGPWRGCLPKQRISSRAEKQTPVAEGAAVTITGTALFQDHQGNDGAGRVQVMNACLRDRQRDSGPTNRAGRLHVGRELEQRWIGQRIKRAPGVKLPPMHPKAMGCGNEGESP